MLGSLAVAAATLFAGASAGTVLWNGDFDYYASTAQIGDWSWSNQVGPYQYYIHGSGSLDKYLDISTAYHHPGICGSTKGLKLSVDQTSQWNGQSFMRTELIPQTTSNLGSGQTYYHFSVKRSATNAPFSQYEHQVVFFESHFTELKYGVSPNGATLQWMIQGQGKYSVPFTADIWYNFAYDINFSSGTVGLWASTGNNPLTRVFAQTSTSTSTNSADWHLGVLAFLQGTAREDWYFDGVYVESGTLTTQLKSGSVASCSGPPPSSSVAPPPSSTVVPPTSTVKPPSSSSTVRPPTSSSAAKPPSTTSTGRPPSTTSSPKPSTTSVTGPQQTHYGQCGGNGYTGPTVCQSPYTCKYSNDWYSQCL